LTEQEMLASKATHRALDAARKIEDMLLSGPDRGQRDLKRALPRDCNSYPAAKARRQALKARLEDLERAVAAQRPWAEIAVEKAAWLDLFLAAPCSGPLNAEDLARATKLPDGKGVSFGDFGIFGHD
jgi:hypothetical protein